MLARLERDSLTARYMNYNKEQKKRRIDSSILEESKRVCDESVTEDDVIFVRKDPPNDDVKAQRIRRTKSTPAVDKIDLTCDDGDDSVPESDELPCVAFKQVDTTIAKTAEADHATKCTRECLPCVARFVERNFPSLCGTSQLYKTVSVTLMPNGLEISGSTAGVAKVEIMLQNMRFLTISLPFSCAKICTHFESDAWKDFTKVLESENRCIIEVKNKESVIDSTSDEARQQYIGCVNAAPTESPVLPSEETQEDNPADLFISHLMHQKVVHTKYGHDLKVVVCQGDITEDMSDAIAHGVPPNFDLTAGALARTVLEKAGPELKDPWAWEHSSFPDIYRVTDGYRLPCRRIIHIALPEGTSDLPYRLRMALDHAEALGCSSIAFPALGTGALGLDPVDVSQWMAQIFRDFAFSLRKFVKVVKVVVFCDHLHSVFAANVVTCNELTSYGNRRVLSLERRIGSPQYDQTVVFVHSDDQRSLDQAKERIDSHMQKYIITKVVENEIVSKLTDHDIVDIYEASLNKFAEVFFNKFCYRIQLVGLSENVMRLYDFVREVWYELREAETMAKICLWMWEISFEEYENLPLRVSRRIEKEYEKHKEGKMSVRLFGDMIHLDFQAMTFRFSSVTGRLKRVDVMSASTQLSGTPSEWSDMYGKSVHLEELSPSSLEYKRVIDRFQQSQPKVSGVCKIERVQNPALYKQYQIRKQDVIKYMESTEPVERELFHGTSFTDAKKIYHYGFDRGFAGKNATAFGKGSYFALDSNYSVSYAARGRNSNEGYMFLALVLTGDYAQGNNRLKAAPEKRAKGKAERRAYDSVVDNVSQPTIFVVFKDSSVYPSYLITFNF